MNPNPNQPDPIDRALAVLRSAQPPAGMDARILQTLDRTHDGRLAGPQPTSLFRSAWLRGALTGAGVATAACTALFFTIHARRTAAPQTAIIAQHSAIATPVALNSSAPCVGPTGIRVPGAPFMRSRADAHGWDKTSSWLPHPNSAWAGGATTTPRPPRLVSASFAPSRPAPPAPLTSQERALIQLVRTATPAQLAALSPATEEKADEKRQADFEDFFAPSPEVRAIDEDQKKALGIEDDQSAPPKFTREGHL